MLGTCSWHMCVMACPIIHLAISCWLVGLYVHTAYCTCVFIAMVTSTVASFPDFVTECQHSIAMPWAWSVR